MPPDRHSSILTRRREQALTVFLLSCSLYSVPQVVVVGGMHFTVLRILILAALARMVAFKESSSQVRFPGGFNAIDKVVVLRTGVGPGYPVYPVDGDAGPIHNIGDFIDGLGGYLAAEISTH